MKKKYTTTDPKLLKKGIDIMFSQAAKSRGTTQLGGCNTANKKVNYDQFGGFSLKDVGKGIETAYHWVEKNKPIHKLNDFVDKVIPPQLKANPIYSGIRNATGVLEQAGFGQIGTIMAPISYPLGRYQPILTGPKQFIKPQTGGSKKTKKKIGKKHKKIGKKTHKKIEK